MREIEITLTDAQPDASVNPWLLLPRPFDDGQTAFHSMDIDGISELHEIASHNSSQRAYLAKPLDQQPLIRYRFVETDSSHPDWFWELQENRYTTASVELAKLAEELTGNCKSQTDSIETLMQHAAGIFGYGHQDQRFNDDHDEVPAICGTAKGSCVDINTYLIAAAKHLAIPVQYMAGYWFHPDKTETLDMHCWLTFQADGKTLHWDLAHHLKWGVDGLAPGLNPAGGRRVPMSCGRGLIFDTPHGEVEISHFSEPVWITNGANQVKPKPVIKIFEDQ